MNPKIKALYDQAMEEVRSHGAFGENERYMKLNPEKFAELIINECINICAAHEDYESFGIYPARVALVTKSCQNNIKEHLLG